MITDIVSKSAKVFAFHVINSGLFYKQSKCVQREHFCSLRKLTYIFHYETCAKQLY